jgi:hypothetical protein
VPIPDPSDELFATTVEFSIVTLLILDVPESEPSPVPIPEPHDELIASTSEPAIKRNPIEELEPTLVNDADRISNPYFGRGPSPHVVPIPEPCSELIALMLEFKIVRLSSRAFA